MNVEIESYLTRELNAMTKEFANIGKSIAKLEVNSQHQEEKINSLVEGNKEIAKLFTEYKKDTDKKYTQLVIKFTAVSTIVMGVGLAILKKILLAAI